MAITYQMRGWDTTALNFVYWTSLDVPDTSPTTTTPPLVGTLANVCVLATDDTAVELPPGGTANQVLAKISATDYDVHWADQMGGSSTPTITLSRTTQLGTTPELVATVSLPAGTYTAPAAFFGTNTLDGSASIQIKDKLGNTLCTFATKTGLLSWATATSGFTLTATTEIEVNLFALTSSTRGFIYNIQF